jgi:hypothetical protein
LNWTILIYFLISTYLCYVKEFDSNSINYLGWWESTGRGCFHMLDFKFIFYMFYLRV